MTTVAVFGDLLASVLRHVAREATPTMARRSSHLGVYVRAPVGALCNCGPVGGREMVQKDEKATEVRLARGPILTTELADLLRVAWVDTENCYAVARFRWKDGHAATVRDVDELSQIEDATNVTGMTSRFTYEDGSSLDLDVTGYSDATVSAKGGVARERQTEITRMWANIPNRSGLHPKLASFVWNARFSLVVGGLAGLIYTLVFRLHDTPVWSWLFGVGLILLGIALWLYDRASPSGQTRRHLLVYHRSESKLERVGVLVGVATGVGSLVVSVVALLLSPPG